MDVKVPLSESQLSAIAGRGYEAAVLLICELAKFCLYEHNQTPSIYDALKEHVLQQQPVAKAGKLATKRKSASERRAAKFIAGIEDVFQSITAPKLASVSSTRAAVIFGPSLTRPSLVYHFDYGALIPRSGEQQAELAQSLLIGLPTGLPNGNIDIAGDTQVCSFTDQEKQENESAKNLTNLSSESFERTVNNVAKKLVRALVMNASTSGSAGNVQGAQKLHILVLGASTTDPPIGLLPKRSVMLQHRKTHLVNATLVQGNSSAAGGSTAEDLQSMESGRIWYQCGKPVKGLRTSGTQE